VQTKCRRSISHGLSYFSSSCVCHCQLPVPKTFIHRVSGHNGTCGQHRSSGTRNKCSSVAVHTSQSQRSVTVVASAEPSPTNGSYPQTLYDDKKDPKYDLSTPLPGWPQLAKLISDKPDFEAFPAFTDLNLKSLLYYQAELSMLRQKLHAAEYADAQTLDHDNLEPSSYGKSLDTLFRSRLAKNPKWQKQWTLIKQIRELLKDYSM
jgi:hypothetical protein